MATVNRQGLQDWIGRQEIVEDVLTAAPVRGLSAALDYDECRALQGQALPWLWHWLYFLPAAPASLIDVDGHLQRGGFLPPIALPRRMWAGSEVLFERALFLGDQVRRVSTIRDIRHKQGSSGELVFVTIHHQIFRGDELAVQEQQNLVYRQASVGNKPPQSTAAPGIAQWSRMIQVDPVLLFRYSALTYNSHRIHYDRDYATRQEGYGGLVVQGPLIATLLMDLLSRELPAERVSSFTFRGVRPLLDGAPVLLQGRREDSSVRLWALDASGALVMDAQAGLL